MNQICFFMFKSSWAALNLKFKILVDFTDKQHCYYTCRLDISANAIRCIREWNIEHPFQSVLTNNQYYLSYSLRKRKKPISKMLFFDPQIFSLPKLNIHDESFAHSNEIQKNILVLMLFWQLIKWWENKTE